MADLKNTSISSSTGALKPAAGSTSQRTATNDTVVEFTTVGSTTFTVPTGVTHIDVLVIGGGGSGAGSLGGGGGAGGYVEATNYPVTPGATYPIVVGAGGAGVSNPPNYVTGYNGDDSRFGDLVAIGGGAGAGYSSPIQGTGNRANEFTYQSHGLDGGSGGGGGGTPGPDSYDNTSGFGESIQGSFPGGAIGYGFPGGFGNGSATRSAHAGGGGGGAGSKGEPVVGVTAGRGGSGRGSSITGSHVLRAGGGGGGAYAPAPYNGVAAPGGAGGGGDGKTTGNGQSGTANTGGGGGCAGYPRTYTSGSGGPGVVIVRYSKEDATNRPLEGALRYNSNLSRNEVYNGTKWVPIGKKTVVEFTSTGPGTFNVPTGITEVEVLVVAGGGAGGSIGGGGGAGGIVHNKAYPVTPGGTVSLSVGAGGAPGGNYPGPRGGNGGNSVFGVHTAIGGGGAGSWNQSAPGPGGSGSGGRGDPGTGQLGGLATQHDQVNEGATQYGYPGARGGYRGPAGSASGWDTGDGQYTAGGGGGAGSAGGMRGYMNNIDSQSFPGRGRWDINFQNNAGRQGGDGVAFDISGEVKYYGGGGGGGAHQPDHSTAKSAAGGKGGGGNGGSWEDFYGPNGKGQNAVNGTGGGGGGGYYQGSGQAEGGDGGDGIIIVRY